MPHPVNDSTTTTNSTNLRKSSRERRCPSRFIARPSKQGISVADGDAIYNPPGKANTTTTTGEMKTHSLTKEVTFQSEGGRILPLRNARNRSTLSSDEFLLSGDNNATTAKRPPDKSKRSHKKRSIPSTIQSTTNIPKKNRKPRVIVIGAGISGLACARELSERRHDVLVLEARNRLGGRLRTVDLMMEEVSSTDNATDNDNDGITTDLKRVRQWSPVDVGGAFIHGTGEQTTRMESDYHTNNNIGSHDFGTSHKQAKSSSSTLDDSTKKTTLRKSSRLSIDYNQKKSLTAPPPINNRKLNPIYVLARRKLRLPVQAAEGAFTCLVDHEGDIIDERVDEEVSREFNEVLDMATKCCESGKMPVGEESMASPLVERGSTVMKTTGGGDSPNYVSDDTAIDVLPSSMRWEDIDPDTNFGVIFEQCRKHYNARNTTVKTYSSKETEVRNHLFQWHVANLEMSSGAPMHKLGQRWNDDEPFGYGGDHSYLEGGFRDIIEALSEGFDCRGVGDTTLTNNEWARCSGDLASLFSPSRSTSATTTAMATNPRGIIQCGIEVNGIEIVEKAHAKMLRKRRRTSKIDVSKCRRSSRDNKGSKMSRIMGSLTNGHRPENSNDNQNALSMESNDERPTSTYGDEESTVVRVTTTCGLTLEADSVVVTLPLAILSIPKGLPGHVSFSPPLSADKQEALSRIGVGTYNKCCMSFSRPFWKHLPRHLSTSSATVPTYWNDPTTHRFDFIGHASNEHGKDILFFNIKNAPILVAIYGGSEYSEVMEQMHDKEVVAGCMDVLKKIFSKATSDCRLTRSQINDLTVPDWPIDYFVSRWGNDPYSRGSFSYIPHGVDGLEELKAMSQPVYDFRPEGDASYDDVPKRPLVLFAGEGTTPFHPSTIHGAFETGIREAYRLDWSLEPELSQYKFDESYLYQPTFPVKSGTTDMTLCPHKSGHTSELTKASNNSSFSAVEDASILRGVETLSPSLNVFGIIKKHMLSPATVSVADIKNRYNFLMDLLNGGKCSLNKFSSNQMSLNNPNWNLPGSKHETWLAPNTKMRPGKEIFIKSATKTDKSDMKKIVTDSMSACTQSRSGRKIQRKTYMDCINFS